MGRTSASTQAIVEFQRLLRSISPFEGDLVLAGADPHREIWYAGEDYGMSAEEIARLKASKGEEDYFYPSSLIGSVEVDPTGAIRSLNIEGGEPTGLPVLAQLLRFIQRHEGDTASAFLAVYPDMRPSGCMIEVDIVGLEDFSGYNYEDVFVESTVSRIIAEFTYDPSQGLLLHRS